MQIHAYPPRAGVDWLRGGARLLRRQPLGLPAMVVVYLLAALLPALVFPPLGALAAIVLNPFASFGLLLACRDIDTGRPAVATAFIAPFRDAAQRARLLQLGLAYAALVFAAGVLAKLVLPPLALPQEPWQSPAEIPLGLLSLHLLFYLPVMVLIWFAPPLAGWHGMNAAKAMFGSAVACLRNIGPLLVFGAAVGVFMLGGAVFAALLPAALASFLAAPLALLLMAIVQASFYPMYRTIFTAY